MYRFLCVLLQTSSQLYLLFLCCYHLFTILPYASWLFRNSSCNWRPISSAYLAASLTKELWLFLPLSLETRAPLPFVGSLSLYSFTVAFIFVTLYSSSIDRWPLPPFSLGKYRMAVEHLGCLPPMLTTFLRASLSNFLTSSRCHRSLLCPH